jgi:hypothetical protein
MGPRAPRQPPATAQTAERETLRMGVFDKMNEGVRKGKELVQMGKEAAIRRSEKMLRIERLKMEITELRKAKDARLRALARKVYELYTRNELKDPELLAVCQELKTLQWQIDELWTEVNHRKEET